MKAVGGTLIAIGAALILWAILSKISVTTDSSYVPGLGYTPASEVANMSLMQAQMIKLLLGLFSALIGAILYAVGELAERLERAGTAKSAENTAPLGPSQIDHHCAYCDRNMSPYKPCSSATDEENRARAARLKDRECIEQFRSRALLDPAADA